MSDASNKHFDEEFDIVVVGYGFAGAAASMAAHDNGARGIDTLSRWPRPAGAGTVGE